MFELKRPTRWLLEYYKLPLLINIIIQMIEIELKYITKLRHVFSLKIALLVPCRLLRDFRELENNRIGDVGVLNKALIEKMVIASL